MITSRMNYSRHELFEKFSPHFEKTLGKPAPQKIKFSINSFMREIPITYRNHSIHLKSSSMDLFLYHRDLRHERIKDVF